MILVDPHSSIPPFEQVRTQMTDAVQRGDLTPGIRLPTVRKLAADLGIAPNTVARAYRELEREGLVDSRGRHGTFVSVEHDALRRDARLAAAQFVAIARASTLSDKEAISIVEHALRLHGNQGRPQDNRDDTPTSL